MRKFQIKGQTMNSLTNKQHILFTVSLIFTSFFSVIADASQPIWNSEIVFPDQQQIISPLTMTVDMPRQRYYVVDTQQGQIVSFDKMGQQLSTFDANAMLQNPVAMCFARPGKMWVIERKTNELLYIDLETKSIRQFSPKDRQGKALFIDHIATDSHWQLYVSDRNSGKIYILDDNMKLTTTFSATSNGQFSDFKITSSGLWALDSVNQSVFHFSLTGKLKKKITLKTHLDRPISLAINDKNQIFILDRPLGKIVVYNTNGEQLYTIGNKGYRRGQLNYPNQILFDWLQRLCIVNQGNNRIEIFNQLRN